MQSSLRELSSKPLSQVQVYEPGGLKPSHTPCCRQRCPIGPAHSSMSAQQTTHWLAHYSTLSQLKSSQKLTWPNHVLLSGSYHYGCHGC